jgi:hypothetical protein
VTVDGIQLPPIVMASSAGQIFRGTLARTLVGAIGYRARSEDEYGNVGLSVLRNFTQTGGPVGTLYGTATPGNLGTVTHRALSLALAGSPLYLAGENLTPGALSFFVLGLGAQTPPLDLSNGLLLNVALPLLLIEPVVVDANGDAVWRIDLPAQAAGLTLRTQVVALDGAGAADFASSRGLALAVP